MYHSLVFWCRTGHLNYPMISQAKNIEHSSAEYNLNHLNIIVFCGKQKHLLCETQGALSTQKVKRMGPIPWVKINDIPEKELFVVVSVKQHNAPWVCVFTVYLLLSCLVNNPLLFPVSQSVQVIGKVKFDSQQTVIVQFIDTLTYLSAF